MWLKNTLEGFSGRLDGEEDRTSDLEDKAVELTQSEPQKGKRMREREESLRDLWENERKWRKFEERLEEHQTD